MNKNGIKTKFPALIFVGIILLMLIAFFVLYPFPEEPVFYDSTEDYQISSYSVSAFVHENGSISITENIGVHFDYPSHGIARYLPLTSEVSFEHGGKQFSRRYAYSITDVKCSSHRLSLYQDDDMLVMRLGSAGQYASENEHYSISYLVSLGPDHIDELDQLYYNFIGTDWDTTLSNISIDIEFEKEVDERDVYFYIGREDEEVFTSSLSGGKAHFAYSGTLAPYSGITARVELENGFFAFPKQGISAYDIVASCLAVIVVAVAIILFVTKNGKRIVPIVEFTPPKDITPADAGYIIDKALESGELSSLVVFWASKGYLKIVENGSDFVLFKLKDADERMKDYEKDIFNAMFSGGDKFNLSSTSLALASAFEKAKIKVKEENKKFFSPFVTGLKHAFLALFAALFALNINMVATKIAMSELSGVFAAVMFGLIFFLALELVFAGFEYRLTMSKAAKWFSIIFGALAAGACYVVSCVYLFKPYDLPTLPIILLPLFCLPLLVLSILLNSRVEGKDKQVGRIIGLRKFIELAEQQRIKVLAKDNPQLFFEVLPYAYVLGVSGEWIDKFSSIELACPSWYVCPTGADFVSVYFGTQLLMSMSSMDRLIMRSIPHSSSAGRGGHFGGSGHIGGGHIGGGHIGGGIGGGGGRRW